MFFSSIAAPGASSPVWIWCCTRTRIRSCRLVPSGAFTDAAEEAGEKGYDFTFWFGLFAPVGVPADVRQKLFDASVAALKDPEVRARLEKSGNAPAPSPSLAEWVVLEGRKSKELTLSSGAPLQ